MYYIMNMRLSQKNTAFSSCAFHDLPFPVRPNSNTLTTWIWHWKDAVPRKAYVLVSFGDYKCLQHLTTLGSVVNVARFINLCNS